ncbi:MAG: outer membrane beta-barrel protein [Planctomycetes bacterium]|nr:outer membrane beta-barrel protein [Planctomycetota bacterium]
MRCLLTLLCLLLVSPACRAQDSHFRVYGWLDSGYTSSTSGSGLLLVEPRMNRFGQEFLLNQAAFVIDRPLKTDAWSLGFYFQFFAGADAAFLQGPGDIQSSNPRFGGTIRQLYLSAHAPVLTEGGVDFVLGRQGSLMGYESYMAPLRPFYSLTYQWQYGEDGDDTGFYATWHVTKQLDLSYGVTLGSNTFFTLRDDSPCHIAQVNYWLQEEKKTLVTGSFLIGDQAVGKTTPFKPGSLATVVELSVRHTWSDFLTQVIQANLGWDQSVPRIGLGQWVGLYTIGIFQLGPKLDLQARAEWFDDVNGTRTGFATNYGALTTGVAFRPRPWIAVRPEVRADFAGVPAFGPAGFFHRSDRQLTAAVECLVKF